LQDESFAAEEAGADLAGERDAEIEVANGAEEGGLLDRELLSRKIEGDDFPGIRTGEGHFPGAPWRAEVGNEEALPRQQLALEAAEKDSFHPRINFDSVGHETICACLGR